MCYCEWGEVDLPPCWEAEASPIVCPVDSECRYERTVDWILDVRLVFGQGWELLSLSSKINEQHFP